MKPIAVVCLCIPLTIVTQANAGFLAVEDFDSNLSGTVNDGMAGWRFTVDDDIYVESLGLFDNDSDGFNASHQVGIWDATGATLLASTTVQAGTASAAQGPTIRFGVFRFESIAPLALSAGESYIIGANYVSDDQFYYAAFDISSSSSISSITGVRSDAGSGFVAPMLGASNRFGPNFTFTTAAEPVPEPSTLALFGIGGLGLCSYRWRRKRMLNPEM